MVQEATKQAVYCGGDGAAAIILERCGIALFSQGKIESADMLLYREGTPKTEAPVAVVNYEAGAIPGLENCRVVTYSADSNSADFTARNLRQLPEGGWAFEIVGVGVIGRVRLRPECSFTPAQALEAAAAAITLGAPAAKVFDALNTL